jgi:hypothetical protein
MKDVLTIPTAMSVERNNNITNTIKAMSKRLLGFIKLRVSNTRMQKTFCRMFFTSLPETPNPLNR